MPSMDSRDEKLLLAKAYQGWRMIPLVPAQLK
jgi:hypothetical protein